MKIAGQACLILLLSLVPAAAAWWLHPDFDTPIRFGLPAGTVRLAEARSWPDPVLWIDARTETERADGLLPGAIHLHFDAWEDGFFDLVERWEPGMRIIVFCGSTGCQTSREVAQRLQSDLGDNDIWVLHRGWDALAGHHHES
ncbi:MAG: rhodanese-like domain-containing protein [Puniceicoccaceae bacterium]|nr:MAG: rhodanese-like domain-containing protein [Puniceicoccaceae bacterium]